VSCKKTYTVKCTSQATIQYLDTHDIKRTQCCNNFTDNSDFVNAIALGADREALQDVLQSFRGGVDGDDNDGPHPSHDAPVEGEVDAGARRKRMVSSRILLSALAGHTSESDKSADPLAQFLSGQLGAARCQACCDAYASLNSGIDPSSGLGTAVSKWTPKDSSKSKRDAHGTDGGDGKSGCPDTIGTCGCCYTKQEETCIRVQDPNYNPDKFKKVPWELFSSNSKSSKSSKSTSNNKSENSKPSKPSRNETSSSSSSADDEASHSGSDSSDSGDKKPKTLPQ